MEYADRVKETSTTTGTGTYSLAGAEAGHQGVVAGIGDGESAYFCAEDGTDWEVFEGTVTAGTPDTLTRDTILASSNSGAAVDWAAGTRNIFLVVPAAKMPQIKTQNLLINGNMDLWQRGTSFIGVAHNDVTAGRWVFGHSAGTAGFKVERATDVPNAGSLYSLKTTVTTASASPSATHESHLRYAMEARFNGPMYAGKVITLSFWVKSNLTGQYSVAFIKPNQARDFEETYLATYTINAADTWERKKITVDLGTASNSEWYIGNEYNLKLRFSYYAGTNFTGSVGWQSGNYIAASGSVNLAATLNNYHMLSQVQFETGPIASPFAPKTINEELLDLNRYELIIGNPSDTDCVGFAAYASATGQSYFVTIPYPTTMRDVPSVTVGTFQVSGCGQPTVNPGRTSLRMVITSSGAGRIAVRSDTGYVPFFCDAEI